MSHDRGCPCGKERWEYEDCDKGKKCFKWDWVQEIIRYRKEKEKKN